MNLLSINDRFLPDHLEAPLSRKFERIVVFTGAGMSAESGIPTFRGGNVQHPGSGLWDRFDPMTLATPAAWQENPRRVWAWYEWRRHLVMNARPHPGHLAVSDMSVFMDAKVITQNVDDLHEREFTQNTLHLHGSLFTPQCSDCGEPHVLPQRDEVNSAPLPIPMEPEMPPPLCHACGGLVRPGVVWFGEPLDPQRLAQAQEWISDCDLLVVVGTSGIVHPAAGLVQCAHRNALLLEINPQPVMTPSNRELVWAQSAAHALPILFDHLYAQL